MDVLEQSGWVRCIEAARRDQLAWSVNREVHQRYAERAQAERDRRAKGREQVRRAVEVLRIPTDEHTLQAKAAPKAKEGCDTSGLQQSIHTGRQLGIRGTPILYLAGGEMVRGFRTAEQLEQLFKNRN